MTNMLTRVLQEPLIARLDIDGADRLHVHRQILERKPMLRDVFSEFHREVMSLDRQFFDDTEGLQIELGAGSCPIRDTFADVLPTDFVPAPHLDRVLDAQAMDLADASVRALYCQNCFHHFPDPDLFFREVRRVVAPGGGIILIEPYYGLFASFLYRRLFISERFDKKATDWTTPMAGPMSGANQALSYIILSRDRARFETLFPEIEIVYSRPLSNYVRYLLSGGLNFRQLVPDFVSGALRLMELSLRPFNRWLSLHHIIVLRYRRSFSKYS